MIRTVTSSGVYAVFVLVFTVAPALHAQQSLLAGRETTGRLESSDMRDSVGAVYDAYVIPGGTPGLLAITVESGDFDTFLELGIPVDGEFSKVLENDDFPGLSTETDSRIYVEGDNNFPWEVRVFDYYGQPAGGYRIRLEAFPVGEPVAQPTAYGADIAEALSESDGFAFQSFQDWYRFRGSAGDRVQVVLESDEFDAYLILRPVNGARLVEDDDGFGGTDAYLEAILPGDGEYEVVVRSPTPAVGDYRLRLGTDLGVTPPPPPAGEPQGPVLQPSGAEEALPLEEWVTGTLDQNDALDADGRPFDGFYAPAGVTGVFAVTLESRDFDAVLEAGPSRQGRYTTVITADDGQGLASPTDARLYLGVQAGQTFEIRALAGNLGAGGDYRIRIDPVEVGDGEPATIAVGEERIGILEEGDAFVFGSFLDRYRFTGRAGERVQIAVDGAFDPYLAVGMVDGAGLADDDDSLDGRGAFVDVLLPADGEYEIQITANDSGTGEYRIRVGADLGVVPASAGNTLAITDQERDALRRQGGIFVNELLDFSFPAPSTTIALLPRSQEQETDPSLHTWYLSEEDGSRQALVIASKLTGGADTGPAERFVAGLVSSLPFQVLESRPAWDETRSIQFVLEAPNGEGADMRCQAAPASRDPGLVVCLLGAASTGESFRPVLAGLEVR